MNGSTTIINRGVTAGIWCLCFLVANVALWAPDFLYPENTFIKSLLVTTAFGILATYVLLLMGVLAVAKEINSKRFVNNTQTIILVNVIVGFVGSIMYVPKLFSPSIISVCALVVLVGTFLLGLYAIRLGKDFHDHHNHLGHAALKAARWYKISGWLIVTLILLPIGFLSSLVADYYMWKMLKKLPTPRITDEK